MFKELAPCLRQRAVLLTVTQTDNDEIRVNIIPQKLKEGENTALTTPLTVTGTAEELDRDLAPAIVGFVAAYLALRNTLDRAKAEMDEAAKAAKAEARSKAKTNVKSEPLKPAAPDTAPKPAEPVKPAPARPTGLFDAPAPTFTDEADEETELPAESDNEEGEAEPLDDAA